MYEIYADGKLLFSPALSDEGYGVINPKVSKEVNKAGSLTFVMPPGHPFYDSMKKLSTIMTVTQDGVQVFRGRVMSVETDFYQRRSVYCEGDLAFLNDSLCRPYTFKGKAADLFKKHIENHNADVGTDAKFTIGTVDITGSADVQITNYSSTMEALNSMVEAFGGYISVRKDGNTRYIDYRNSASGTSGQTIEFGRNLLDLQEYITAEDVFTVLIPLGKMDDKGQNRVNIKSVNNNKDYIQDDAAVALFGKIWKTHSWDEVEKASTLLSKGRAYLKKGIAESVTLTINAVDLHLVDVDTDKIECGYKIRVKSSPHGLDADFLCSALTLDLVNPDKSTYTFGNPKNTASKVMATTKQQQDQTEQTAASHSGAISGGGKRLDEVEEDVWNMGTDIEKDREHIKLLAWSNFKQGEITNSGSSSINLTWDQILSEVQSLDISDTKGLINKCKSSIQQTASKIESKVEKNGIISAINQTHESVTIQASKINLQGYVTATQLSTVNARINNIMSGDTTASLINCSSLRLAGYSLYLGSITVDGTKYAVVRWGGGD